MTRTSLALFLLAVACSGSTETVATPGGALDLVGVWHSCAARLEFRADGSFTRARYLDGCTETGSFEVTGHALALHFAPGSDCEKPSVDLDGILAEKSDGRLFLVHPDFGGVASYFPDTAPRARFDLLGKGSLPAASGESIVHIVGDPDAGPFSACYWSADGKCGGLFSCGGNVDEWQSANDSLIAKLGCSGSCPCAAILQGKLAAGSVSGTFQGADCNSAFDGTFSATPLAEP